MATQVDSNMMETGVQTITPSVSTATTVLPIPPLDILIIQNPSILTEVVENSSDWVGYASRSEALASMASGLFFF